MSLRSLLRQMFDCSANSTSRPRGQRALLGCEPLERRELLVAGATVAPTVVTPGSGLDGVVAVQTPTGSCTGSLLYTGRHILTAAHCVDSNFDRNGDGKLDTGDGRIDLGSYTVTFDLPGKQITTIPVGAANVWVPAGWDGDWREWPEDANVNGRLDAGEDLNGDGRLRTTNKAPADVAIIELPSLAPSGPRGVGAERYQIHRLGDGLANRTVTLVGYGATGLGVWQDPDGIGPQPAISPGHDNTFGTKRSGLNQLDGVTPTETIWTVDLDNGAVEAITAPGDSGGPGFVNGVLHSVTSYGNFQQRLNNLGLPNYPLNAFGATAGLTRVVSFASWIDATIGPFGGYDLVLDMNKQLAGDDDRSDLIQVRLNGELVELVVNGSVYHRAYKDDLNSLRIVGSPDNDIIQLDIAAGLVPFAITVSGGDGNDHLRGPSATNQWDITSYNSGSLNKNDYRANQFFSIEELEGNAGSDTFSFSTYGRITGNIFGGNGYDWLDYSRLTIGVTVDLASGQAANVTNGAFGIEGVIGGSAADWLFGDSRTNWLIGNGGADHLYGRSGDDWLFGGTENDWLYGESGSDRLYGLEGNDVLNAGADLVIDWLYGGSENDVFETYDSYDYLMDFQPGEIRRLTKLIATLV